jgi:hypothetical protein
MEIDYEGRKVVPGLYLTPYQTREAPHFYLCVEPRKPYTLLMFDPDALGGNRIHYMEINIQGSRGNIVFPYDGPHPPKGSGVHHYYFWFLEQQHPLPPVPRFRSRYLSLENLFQHFPTPFRRLQETFFTSSWQPIPR